MKGLPLSTDADIAQVERVRPLLESAACVVVGSAPLATNTAVLEPHELAIAVNGAISSLDRDADLWVVGSKKQDKRGDPFCRPLHQTMLDQAAGRRVAHALFLRGPTVASERYTLAALARMQCRIENWSVFDKPTKRWLEGELCARVNDKAPCSSGILAAAIAFWCGAASVRLVGFSFRAGYHYLPKGTDAPQWWRNHVDADRRAIQALRERYGDRFAGAVVQAVAA